MAALDRINARFGREALRFAATGLERPWKMRQARRSPRFTTVWEELPEVRALGWRPRKGHTGVAFREPRAKQERRI